MNVEDEDLSDPDFQAERLGNGRCLKGCVAQSADCVVACDELLHLRTVDGAFAGDSNTAALLRSIGGSPSLHRMIGRFYEKVFSDRHIKLFILNPEDPHATRLANWLTEKMEGEGDVWSAERAERAKCPVVINLPKRGPHVVHDRTTAHVAAWFCENRETYLQGQRFQLHDCRVWMRLMFWSAREDGLLENPVFSDWYVKFLGHFIKVYEQSAPPFARDSFRWSMDQNNIDAYLANGNCMDSDILGAGNEGISHAAAISQLPAHERPSASRWPYE